MPSAKQIRRALSGFIKTDDLEGQHLDVTIKEYVEEEIEGQWGKRKTPIISFAETNKRLPLNGTRVDDLEQLFGDSDVVGKKVRLAVGVRKTKNKRMIETITIEADGA